MLGGRNQGGGGGIELVGITPNASEGKLGTLGMSPLEGSSSSEKLHMSYLSLVVRDQADATHTTFGIVISKAMGCA